MRHIFSCGGGVQSTACLVLAAQVKIPYRTFIFANVGDKAESPHTVSYIRLVLKPYAKKHGIDWVDVAWVDRSGRKRDLYEDQVSDGSNRIQLPAFLPGGMPMRRICTTDYKIKPIAKWIKANAPGCTLGVGISTDEPHRAKPARDSDSYIKGYPLIDLGIDRSMCLRIVENEGLPQPPKSSCWFCPYKTTEQWTIMRRSDPELFASAVNLERIIQGRRTARGKDSVYLSAIGARRGVNLADVIPDQLGLFPEWIDEQDGCESGYCMT